MPPHDFTRPLSAEERGPLEWQPKGDGIHVLKGARSNLVPTFPFEARGRCWLRFNNRTLGPFESMDCVNELA